jgi:hypothetical protein
MVIVGDVEMKIRTGFVSNSSSSSFVFLGWKLKETDPKEVCQKFICDDCVTLGCEECDSIDMISSKEGKSFGSVRHINEIGMFFGRTITGEDEGGLDESDIDISDWINQLMPWGEHFGLVGPPHLFTGTYPC